MNIVDFLKRCKTEVSLFFLLWAIMLFDMMSMYVGLLHLSADRLERILTNSLCHAIMALAVCITLPKKAKWFAAVSIVLFLLLDIVLFWCQRTFAMLLDGDIIFILHENDLATCMNFVRDQLNLKTSLYFVLGIGAMTMVLRAFRRIGCSFSWKKLAFSCATLLLVLGIKYDFSVENTFRSSAAGNLIYDLGFIRKTYGSLVEALANPTLPPGIRDLVHGSTNEPPALGVVIIGESVSRNYMSIYGYGRPTTPAFDRMKASLYAFSNCQTITLGTGVALRYIATQKIFHDDDSRDICSFLDVYKAAGWRVVVLSTPPRWGRWETVEGLIFNAADKKIYLSELREDPKDHNLLPHFREELADLKVPTLFVFHLTGSHTPLKNAYPADFGLFDDLVDDVNRPFSEAVRRRINEYCNSLAWTDRFLGRILEQLKALPNPSFFLYTSDHGESITSDSFRRYDNRDAFVVPLVMWFSDEYKRLYGARLANVGEHLDAPVEIDKLFWSLLHMGTISYDGFPEEHNLFSKEYKPTPFKFFPDGSRSSASP